MGILTDIIRNRIAGHDAAEKERRDNVSKAIFSMIQAGTQAHTLTPDQLEWAIGELKGIHKDKNSKQALDRYGGVVGSFVSAPGAQKAVQAPNETPTGEPSPLAPQAPPEVRSPTGEPVPGAPSEAAQLMPPYQPPPETGPALRPPSGVGSLVPNWPEVTKREREAVRFGTEEDVRKAQLLYEQRKKIGKELDLKGEALNDYAATGHYPTPQKPLVIKGLEREGQEGLWTKRVYSDGTVEWDKEGPKATAIRVTASEVTTLPHARELAAQGKVYEDENGKPLDLDKIPEGMMIQAVHQGARTFYTTRDIADKVVTIGGVAYGVNPHEVQKLPQGAGTRLGVTAIPRVGTTAVAAIDPVTGEMVWNEAPTTSTPQATGIPGRPEAPSPTAPPAAPPAPGAQPSPSPPPAPGSTPGLRGIPLTSLNQFLPRVTPVREAHAQIFGDPTQPEFTPLASYADLADDFGVQQRVGTALRYVLNQIKSSGTIERDTFGGWLKNLTGLRLEMDRAAAGVPADLYAQMSQNPREIQLFNRSVETLSTMIGLRGLTRAAATQATANRLEADAPLVGINTYSKSAFYDKLIPLAEMTYLGTQGIPALMYHPDELKDIKELPKRLTKLRDESLSSGAQKVLGGPGQPSQPPKPLKAGTKIDVETARKYLQASGGDQAKAKAKAKSDGWEF